jgi:hypothetical protein
MDVPGSLEERRRFAALQARLPALYKQVFGNPQAPRTVVVVPSLSLDAKVLANITGVQHYEERLLCLLMLLRLPRTRVVLVTSQPVHPSIIDYYLHLLPGVPAAHARARLTLLSAHDGSSAPLTQKILARPRLLERLRAAIPDPMTAHLTCFNATGLERTLAVELGVPLYACDPDLSALGSKSGSREVFREAGVELPDGFENLRDEGDVVNALGDLKRRHPALSRAAVKLNEGASGEGNAIFAFDGCPPRGGRAWIRRELPKRLRFEAPGERYESFFAQFAAMGGVVESWVEGVEKRSPSVQCRINPVGQVHLVSTHDQVLGGPSGQIYLGASFPADAAYRCDIQAAGLRIGKVLQDRGALGRFGVDFVSVKEGPRWRHLAIEVNLRKGGTTHPFMMLQFLTDGVYDAATGLYLTPTGEPRYYYTSDNLQSPSYRGLSPDDLIDISVYHGLHFHGAEQQGVVFHLIGALSEFGKLGVVCLADSPQGAQRRYAETVAVLDQETRGRVP